MDHCVDNPSCQNITFKACEAYKELKMKCPMHCGVCSCKDHISCTASETTPEICALTKEAQRKCPLTCGLCKSMTETGMLYAMSPNL